MLLRMLWAALTGQRIIALEDHDTEVTWTFAHQTPFGWTAKRHWPSSIAIVKLLPDGKVKGCSYVERWWSAEPLPGLEPPVQGVASK